MNKENAVNAARVAAIENRVRMVVVNDPIANAEDEAGPWGYAPYAAVDVLFAHRVIADDYYFEVDGYGYSASELGEWIKVAVIRPEGGYH